MLNLPGNSQPKKLAADGRRDCGCQPEVVCTHEVIESRTLSECSNEPLTPVGRTGPLISNIPVVLAEPRIQIALEAVVKLPEPMMEIKRILKKVCVTQCKLVPAGKFDADTELFKLFLAGYVRKNIEYATAACRDGEEGSGDIQHTTVEVPFDCVTEVEVPFGTAVSGAERPSGFGSNDVSGCDPREQLRRSFEVFREDPFCELVDVEINELDMLEKPEHGYKSGHGDGIFTTVREKMVLQMILKVLQKQQVEIPGPTPTPTPTPTPPNILFAFAENQDPLPIPEDVPTPILSIPPFTTTDQIIKLESMAEVALVPSSDAEFRYGINYALRRDGIILALTNERGIARGELHLTPNITWVDTPPPGTHTYEIWIQISTSPDVVSRTVLNRALTATLFPPSNVLPSTSM